MRRLTTIPIPKRVYTLRTPKPVSRTMVIPKAEWNLVDTSYFVGKGITLFVGFYTYLQWLYYRKQRKDMEDD